MKHGNGILKMDQGSYQGEFQNDMISGQGEYFWTDGKKY